MAARLLIEQGHGVVLHARSERRAQEALAAVPGAAETVVIGDLASIAQTRSVADQVNRLGRFDAVIHNAGVGYRDPMRIATEDGLPQVFAVNTLAPYILTALIERPQRLVYLSSGLHRSGDATLKDLAWENRAGQNDVLDTGQIAGTNPVVGNLLGGPKLCCPCAEAAQQLFSRQSFA